MLERPWRRMFGAAAIVLLISTGGAVGAQAEQECVIAPSWRQITRSQYVQEFGLECLDQRVSTAERLKQAREVLALYRELCREVGEDAQHCRKLLLAGATSMTRDIVDAAERLETHEERESAKVREAPANPNPVVWRSPTLLTNDPE